LDFRHSKLNPLLAGAEIKKRIRQEVGEWLTCSVGIAPNKFMAKLAADMQKPDGLSVLWRDQLPEVYKHKQLTDLWGINHGWQNRLAKLNITSPLQLLGYPVENLISIFGKPGFFIWQRVNGLEEDVIKSSFEGQIVKSFGHSWVLNFRTTDKERLKIAILRLAEKAARRMRRERFIAFGMYLSVTLNDGTFFHRSKKLRFSIETGLELYQEAMQIWKAWNFDHEAMHIAVGFGYLSLKTPQLSLFPDRTSALTPTLDLINDKYGEFTIRPGLLTNTTDFAPDAIAFGK
jgi:DNA polymerase-4